MSEPLKVRCSRMTCRIVAAASRHPSILASLADRPGVQLFELLNQVYTEIWTMYDSDGHIDDYLDDDVELGLLEVAVELITSSFDTPELFDGLQMASEKPDVFSMIQTAWLKLCVHCGAGEEPSPVVPPRSRTLRPAADQY